MTTASKGFKNLRFFPTNGFDEDGFPTSISEGIILGKKNETNNKALSLSDTIQSSTFNADDVVDEERTITTKTGELSYYNVEKQSLIDMFHYTKDDNNNLMDNPDEKTVGVLFFETKKNDGTVIQHWFYDVTIYPPADSFVSFDGTNYTELKSEVIIRPVFINNVRRFKSMVFNGQTGFDATGCPKTIYKPVITPITPPSEG